MTITERNFQAIVQLGGIALAICIIANLYFVMRFREVYRDRMRAELEFQQAMQQVQKTMPQLQVFENVIRGFIPRAATDPKVAEILQRYQVIVAAPATVTNQGSGGNP
jgi:TRAP-type C4-dicarboxylate transport system permease large subunit